MITSLVRSNLKNFQAYSSARSLYQKGLFLDANENALGSTIAIELDNELNRYPDPYSLKVREALGKFLKIPRKNIFAGNGSDEAIDLLIRLFVEPNEEIIILEPTYGIYKVAAALAGVKVKNISLEEGFNVDVSKLLKQANAKTKIIFCCSPNNPTGTMIPADDIEKLCKNFKGIVVVDEAYIEFASKPSLVSKVRRFDNLVVLRTFSKAWGLAGIRCGYAVADEIVIEYLNKIKAPYNLNRISGKLAIQALNRSKKMYAFKKVVLEEREKLSTGLAALGFKIFPSEANFLLVRYPNSGNIAKVLAKKYRIIIRDFSDRPRLKDCVRISVGTPKQNRLLIKVLSQIL